MTFENPKLLLLLWVIPTLLILWTWLQLKSKNKLSHIIPTSQWKNIIPGLSYKRRFWIIISYLVCISCLIIAASQPRYGYKVVEKSRKGLNILIALDTSKSMLAKDLIPNRFTIAKQEIMGLVHLLKGDQIGLILFAGKSFIQCPLTLDYSALSLFLRNSNVGSIPSPGSDLAQAI